MSNFTCLNSISTYILSLLLEAALKNLHGPAQINKQSLLYCHKTAIPVSFKGNSAAIQYTAIYYLHEIWVQETGGRGRGGRPQKKGINRECARANISTHLRLKAGINIVYRSTINRPLNRTRPMARQTNYSPFIIFPHKQTNSLTKQAPQKALTPLCDLKIIFKIGTERSGAEENERGRYSITDPSRINSIEAQ